MLSFGIVRKLEHFICFKKNRQSGFVRDLASSALIVFWSGLAHSFSLPIIFISLMEREGGEVELN